MDWLAFLAGVAIGYLLKSNPQAASQIKAFTVAPLAKLKKQERVAPKYNDDRKAVARERGDVGATYPSAR